MAAKKASQKARVAEAQKLLQKARVDAARKTLQAAATSMASLLQDPEWADEDLLEWLEADARSALMALETLQDDEAARKERRKRA